MVQQPQAAGCTKRSGMKAWMKLEINPEFLLNIAVLVGIQTPASGDFLLNRWKSLLIPCVTSLAAPIVVW